MDKKTKIIIILAAVVVILVGIVGYLLIELGSIPKTAATPVSQNPSLSEVNAGDVGEKWSTNPETGRKEPYSSSNMPLSIFSTSGTIKGTNNNEVLVKGNGDNFADESPRELVVTITENTKVFAKGQRNSFLGEKGFDILREGMNILISSDMNIRGKTEFPASTITIIE